MHRKFRGEISYLSDIGAHEKPQIEPYPEEVQQNPQVKRLFEQKGHGKTCDDVQLRQNRVWNYYVSADEGHTRVKLLRLRLLLQLRHIRQNLFVRLLSQTKEQSYHYEIDRAVFKGVVVLSISSHFVYRQSENKVRHRGQKC